MGKDSLLFGQAQHRPRRPNNMMGGISSSSSSSPRGSGGTKWKKAFGVLFAVQVASFFALLYYVSSNFGQFECDQRGMLQAQKSEKELLQEHWNEVSHAQKQKRLIDDLQVLNLDQKGELSRLTRERDELVELKTQLEDSIKREQERNHLLELERDQLLQMQNQKPSPLVSSSLDENHETKQGTEDLTHFKASVDLSKSDTCLQPPQRKAELITDRGLFDIAHIAGIAEAQQSFAVSAPNCFFDEPNRQKKDTGGFCFPERNTGGAAASDFDMDGLVDLVISSFISKPYLYRNRGDGTFEDITETHLIGMPENVKTNGAYFADVNNDGFPDLIMTTFGKSNKEGFLLFMNDGTGKLVEEGRKRHANVFHSPDDMDAEFPRAGGSIAVGDYDGDGWLDIFYCEWLQEFVLPEKYRDSKYEKGMYHHSRLLRNTGGGFFEDVTERVGLGNLFDLTRAKVKAGLSKLYEGENTGGASFETTFTLGIYTFGANFIDLDRDGFLDLAITSDFFSQMLFWNNGDGTFTEGAVEANLGACENAMGSSFADVDGDGYMDWFMTGISDTRPREFTTMFGTRGNFFFRNNGEKSRTFSDWTDKLGIRHAGWAWGAALFDVDNDGDVDSFVSNGFFMAETTYEDTFNIFPSKLFVNHGHTHGPWEDVDEHLVHPDGSVRQGRGVLVFDFDRDGDLDVLVVNNAHSPYLYENRLARKDHGWLQVEVFEHGRVAYGAYVFVQDRGFNQTAVIGAVTGFQGQSEPMAHFGFGTRYFQHPIERVEVVSPASGYRKVLTRVPRNHRLKITLSHDDSDIHGIQQQHQHNNLMQAPIRLCNDKVEPDISSSGDEMENVDHGDSTLDNLPKLKPMAKDLEHVVEFIIREHIENGRSTEWRSFDGSRNNVKNPDWGIANSKLARRVENAYEDKISKPAGSTRPSARYISNVLCSEPNGYSSAKKSRVGLSDVASHFGQLLAHDTDHTTPMANTFGGEYFPISVPKGDVIFDPQGTGQEILRFRRSNYDPSTGSSRYNPRQQMNKVTAYVDASVVYGSDEKRASHLRLHKKGLLRVGPGNSLPFNTKGLPNDNPLARETRSLHLAGDARVNIQPGLFAMHTLFHREHNYLARHFDRIAKEKLNVTLDDDELFYMARRVLIAEYQMISYLEYLPAMLGTPLGGSQGWTGYDPEVNPAIFNTFSTAAFRFGHAQANNKFPIRDESLRHVSETLHLNETYFAPDASKVDGIIRGMLFQKSKEIDLTMSDNLRNHLFGPKSQGGVDLAAVNIQRGRDHGLNHFNAIRKAFQLPELTSFDQFNDIGSLDIDPRPEEEKERHKKQIKALERVYKNDINNIDAFIGFLAEIPEPLASVGVTMSHVLLAQFRRLKVGDRFFYESLFPPAIVKILEKECNMRAVILRNIDIDEDAYNVGNAFFVPDSPYNVHLESAKRRSLREAGKQETDEVEK